MYVTALHFNTLSSFFLQIHAKIVRYVSCLEHIHYEANKLIHHPPIGQSIPPRND